MAEPKLVWMPLYVPEFLADTVRLDALLTGAYALLMLDEFLHGPLPNDEAQLLRISKLNDLPGTLRALGFQGDATSIALASLSIVLKTYFTLTDDGRYTQKRVEHERAKAIERLTMYHERAKKAARARWKKQGKKYEDEAKIGDATSIAQAMPTTIVSTTPTVLTAFEPPGKSASPPPRGGHASSIARASEKDPPAVQPKTEKRKPSETSDLGARKARAAKPGTRPSPATENRAGELGKGRQRAPGDKAAGRKTDEPLDPRTDSFKHELEDYWKAQNPRGAPLTWDSRLAASMRGMLQAQPELTVDRFMELLRARAQSEVNPAELPYTWLRDIDIYSAGPLDRYRKPLTSRRQL